MDWLVKGVRFENSSRKTLRILGQRTQLIEVMRHFMQGVRTGESGEQLLFVLTEIYAYAAELFRLEAEILSEATDQNNYRERYRNTASKAKHQEILTDIDAAIRAANVAVARPHWQEEDARPTVCHAIDSLVMHLALARRTPGREAIA